MSVNKPSPVNRRRLWAVGAGALGASTLLGGSPVDAAPSLDRQVSALIRTRATRTRRAIERVITDMGILDAPGYNRTQADAKFTLIDTSMERRTAPRSAWKASTAFLYGTAGGNTLQNSVGLTKSGNVISATTPGTEGRVWTPLLNANKSCRLSATVLASKATAGSQSLIQVVDVALGTTPTGSERSIGLGYVQGTGIVLRRSDGSFDVVLKADTAITDGEQYRVTFVYDNEIRSAGAPDNPFWYGAIHDTDGNLIADGLNFSGSAFPGGMGMLQARTTVANGLTDLYMGQGLGDECGQPSIMKSVKYTALSTSEQATIRVPAKPNGRLVVILHGRGGNDSTMATSTQYEPTWKMLIAAGYTLFMPKMGGDTWWSPTARSYIVDGVNRLCSLMKLDRNNILLWGDSMGGGTALALIGNNDFGAGNVAAAYVAEPACDLANVRAANAGFTEIDTLYPASADKAAASPINLPTANYAGVPILFLASTSDTVVPKAANTDAMRTKIGGVTNAPLLPTTGAHTDYTHYNSGAALGWFSIAIG